MYFCHFYSGHLLTIPSICYNKPQGGEKMSAFLLKMIAMFLMLVDHTGAILIKDPNLYMLCRTIGRLSFPIFAWLIANGYYHTKNKRGYLIRLIIAGIISEPFFDYGLYGTWFHIQNNNIFFTLATGLGAIYVFDYFKEKSKATGFILVILLGIIAQGLNFDYGLYGVLLIFVSYYYFHNYGKLAFGFVAINLYFTLSNSLQYYLQTGSVGLNYIQALSLLALPIIGAYNGDKGKSMKYFFYVFYPLHLVILRLIAG